MIHSSYEYRIMAYFNGTVYGPRSYKRMVFTSKEEAERYLPQATQYYSSGPYKRDIHKVVIETREVSEWKE